ncbi:hypothetical protein H2198_010379 [Neophaeococcomyces mojaviensis]|uniref:Uncharacterized protein n=1 Tax=Neophaeococcomyces mojaviensis TaxID=3383035 RepID=A0ACC2ZRV1_9EURO|nr:hypothetical protein H2198_010379 [Knufia sp. JES_112]
MDPLNESAKTFQALHKPGKPIVLANVWDIPSAHAVASLPSCKAVASASWAVAKAAGTEDDDLTLEQNLEAARKIGKIARQYNKPFTCDLQDGYQERLEEAIEKVIEAGAVGINLEDVNAADRKQYSQDEAVSRVKRALAAAKKAGVDNFVVNARCDTLLKGGDLDEVISRGKAYLAAGATTVFVWGGARGTSKEEVVRMVKEFDGRLNVSMRLVNGLNVQELSEIGVARISVGPQLLRMLMASLAEKADSILSQRSR